MTGEVAWALPLDKAGRSHGAALGTVTAGDAMLMLVDEVQGRPGTGDMRGGRIGRAVGGLGGRMIEVVMRIVAGPEPEAGQGLAGVGVRI